jgi:molybdopterin/thiamine biosynthesis adenylyltransferase
MKFGEKALFYNSVLLFSEKSLNKFTNSTIAIAGIGGIGSIATEMLARNGIGSLTVSDIDPYEEKNLNRQLFATHETIGVNKAVAAKDRIKLINPDCKVKVYENGIRLDNVEEFCSGADIILVQTDTESTKIILHRTAKKFGIPAICGSRSSLIEHRWKLKARVWDYKKNPNFPCYDETNHPEMVSIPTEKMTEEMLREFDEKIKLKKIKLFQDFAKSRPEIFGSISSPDLLDRLDNCKNFFNRHVCSVIANTGGVLAATAALKYLLTGEHTDLEINLWGNADINKSDLASPEEVFT